MPVKPFVTINADDFVTSKLQSNISNALDPVTNQPDMPKRLLTGINLSTVPVSIPHGLGVPFQGFIVVRATGPASVYEDMPANNPLPATTLRLIASAPVTVSLLVF